MGASYPMMALNTASRAARPYLLSMLKRERSRDSVARRSPWVRAPYFFKKKIIENRIGIFFM